MGQARHGHATQGVPETLDTDTASRQHLNVHDLLVQVHRHLHRHAVALLSHRQVRADLEPLRVPNGGRHVGQVGPNAEVTGHVVHPQERARVDGRRQCCAGKELEELRVGHNLVNAERVTLAIQ